MAKRLDLKNALQTIKDFYYRNQRIPSLSETAGIFNYSSRNTALYLLNKLVETGYMTRGTKGRLLTTPKFHDKTKLLGSISAGFPAPEEEELRQSLSLDEFLIRKPSATYMLEVSGDSMIGAGILPKDFVLVEKGRTPAPGDIVIAQVDGEWTMKYYRMENGKVYLQAANAKYPDIYAKEELVIAGVVISCVRNYA
ncbi:MAG: hypothetical protein DKM50_10420 [Candidatus Margulisiibacteriota bacterium]|nr:MAG: hypothetical protein DKM50_10420 [Candidatus Margulisiibacteriota bacterium]HCY35622.1 hypothetical protein [Candidatus Margulisiibacteriota bacterium]